MKDTEADATSQDPTTSFLLAEHTRLSELYLETRETADRRVTLFLTLTTTIAGALVALFQFKLPFTDFVETTLASAMGIVILGAITFHRVTERSMQGTEYLRAINRLHHYFVEHSPEIEAYLYWPAHDDIPHYDSRGVGGAETREIVMLIDSAFAGAAVVLAVLNADRAQVLLALALGAAAFGVAVYAHRRYERFVMAREERRKAALVRFPEEARTG